MIEYGIFDSERKLSRVGTCQENLLSVGAAFTRTQDLLWRGGFVVLRKVNPGEALVGGVSQELTAIAARLRSP